MAKTKPRTVADFVRDERELKRTDRDILIVAGETRWEPHKAEVAALLAAQPPFRDIRSVVQGPQTIRFIKKGGRDAQG